MIIKTKKSHPCGCDSWKILKLGADVKIKCEKCGHVLMFPNSKFKKIIK